MSDITRVLTAIQRGDLKASEELLPLVYQDLRRLAAYKMANEPAGHTLQPTALVHEAWLRLGDAQGRNWENGSHFFAAAGEAMRRILVECARRKARIKRGGDLERLNVEELDLPLPLPDEELLVLDEALERLTAWEPETLRTTFEIADNRISGMGPTDAGWQHGILIDVGASGEIKRNTISDYVHSGADLRSASYGILAFDGTRYAQGLPLLALQPIRYEDNTFRNNQQHLASVLAHGSQFVNNVFAGSGSAARPFGIALSGRTNFLSGNYFSDMSTGILLFGRDPDFGQYLGLTTNPKLVDNRFCNVATPVITQALVSGAIEQGTLRCPFSPMLDVAPAVLLTWPGYAEDWHLEASSTLHGPWLPTDGTAALQHGLNTITIKTDTDHLFFRLRKP